MIIRLAEKNMNTRQIIGLMGAKGAGKDTAASFLLKERGFQRIGFADKLYREAAEAFGVPVEFLGDRTKVQTPTGPVEMKEYPQPELALENCRDPAFAQCALEELVAKNVTMQVPLSPRVVMQLWGTEYRRKRGVDSYWLDIVKAALDAAPGQNFVITDVRFPNEHAFVRNEGGDNLRVRNLAVEAQEESNRSKNGTAAHASETSVTAMPVYVEIFNQVGDLASLRADVLAAADALREAVVV
jgi:hypothetical protein